MQLGRAVVCEAPASRAVARLDTPSSAGTGILPNSSPGEVPELRRPVSIHARALNKPEEHRAKYQNNGSEQQELNREKHSEREAQSNSHGEVRRYFNERQMDEVNRI